MKRILIIVSITLAILLAAGAGLVWYSSRPITKEQAHEAISEQLKKEVEKNDTVTQALIHVASGEKNFEGTYVAGQLNGQDIDPSMPFHVASVGKAFTATIAGMLVEEGRMSFDDPISDYLSDELLEDLFVYEGIDYKDQVTIKQLLNHTSGVADYFSDPTISGPMLVESIIADPEKLWTPEDLIAFSREHQVPVGAPGETYHYSDTGYILLGRLLEAASGESFHSLLQKKILVPLELNDTYLTFYTEPVNPVRPYGDVWLEGSNLRETNALSVDWSGGGLISTLDDLTTFIIALNQGELVDKATLEEMYAYEHKFMTGIHYGLGFMVFEFEEFFPLLGHLPDLKGHMGTLGVLMLYDEVTETVYVASYGSSDHAEGSVRTMIQVLSIIANIED